MSKIIIEVMSDWNDCEQCGGGSEDGGRVLIDGEVVFGHIPCASCFGNQDVRESDLIKIAFERLGHTLEINYVHTQDYDEGEEIE